MIYRDLKVWQKSIDFVIIIYEITKKFPQKIFPVKSFSP
ncbi:MAG: four helix bundle protein [Deltaproteobacteria bacterium]|nr:four helix bundle protein [Deltaproteobacteria bacterium]